MKNNGKILRFSRNWRVQHLLLLISVTLLILSGLALRYSSSWVGKFLIFLEGGFEARGSLHRFSAVLLFITCIYHLIYIVFTKEGRGEFKSLILTKKDFSDYFKKILFDIGKEKEKPPIGRYGYAEKFQYWAFFFFVIIMGVSGTILWFHNYFFGFFPKWLFDLSMSLHGWTGTLILLFLVLWHIYIVHLSPTNFPINTSFWDGYVDEKWLKREHLLEYEELFKRREKI